MDFSCEQLGITKEEMQERIVQAIATTLITSRETMWTEWDEEEEGDVPTSFGKKMQEHIEKTLQERLDLMFAQFVKPGLHDVIDKMTFQESNRWGEPRKEAETFKEFFARVMEEHLKEDVDSKGQTRAGAKRSGRTFYKEGTRLEVAIGHYLNSHVRDAVNGIVAEGDKQMSILLKDLITETMVTAAKKLTVTIDRKGKR